MRSLQLNYVQNRRFFFKKAQKIAKVTLVFRVYKSFCTVLPGKNHFFQAAILHKKNCAVSLNRIRCVKTDGTEYERENFPILQRNPGGV